MAFEALAAGASSAVEPQHFGRAAAVVVQAAQVGRVAVLATRAWPACAALLLLVVPVAVVLLHSSR